MILSIYNIKFQMINFVNFKADFNLEQMKIKFLLMCQQFSQFKNHQFHE